MIKKVKYLIFIVSILLTINIRAGTYSGGDGTAANPYKISTPADMNEIETHPNDWDQCFILTADIDILPGPRNIASRQKLPVTKLNLSL